MNKIIKVEDKWELLGFFMVKEPVNPQCYINYNNITDAPLDPKEPTEPPNETK